MVGAAEVAGGTPRLPVLPLRDIVILPGCSVPLFVGRPRSVAAVRRARAEGCLLLLAVQRHVDGDVVGMESLFPHATLATIEDGLDLPDGTLKVLVRSQARCRLVRLADAGDHWHAGADRVADAMDEVTGDALQELREAFLQFAIIDQHIAASHVLEAVQMEAPAAIDRIASLVPVGVAESAAYLGLDSPNERLRACASWIAAREEARLAEMLKHQGEISRLGLDPDDE